jgi:hypothetical protein
VNELVLEQDCLRHAYVALVPWLQASTLENGGEIDCPGHTDEDSPAVAIEMERHIEGKGVGANPLHIGRGLFRVEGSVNFPDVAGSCTDVLIGPPSAEPIWERRPHRKSRALRGLEGVFAWGARQDPEVVLRERYETGK